MKSFVIKIVTMTSEIGPGPRRAPYIVAANKFITLSPPPPLPFKPSSPLFSSSAKIEALYFTERYTMKKIQGGYHLSSRGRCKRGFHPAIVPIGENNAPKPLPHVESTLGQQWIPYNKLVEKRAGSRLDLSVFQEMLDKAGFRFHKFAEESSSEMGNRNLYIAVGPDIQSATLLACAQDWVERTRPGITLTPIQIRLPIPGVPRIQNVIKDFFEERGVSIKNIAVHEEDLAQVETVFPDPIDFEKVSLDDPRIKMLVRWVVYHRVKIQEKHPFGAAVLWGTNLDRNLQKIADFLVPEEELEVKSVATPDGMRPRKVGELWDLSLEPTPSQLPMFDTANADWKQGVVMNHRPFLALRIETILKAAEIFKLDKLAPILGKPPPIYSRLDPHQSAELLKLVKKCHVRTRALRRTAAEFVRSNCRLDYKLGWCTMNRAAAKELPAETLQVVLSALVGFTHNKPSADWIKSPPESILALIPLIKGTGDNLPSKKVTRLEGTAVSVILGEPYETEGKVSSDFGVVTFVCTPDEEEEEVEEFPEFASKTESHPHPPTKCMTGTQFGRWLVQLFCSDERRVSIDERNRVFYVTRLRDFKEDAEWYRQFTNGPRFVKSISGDVHSTEMHFSGHPTRPSPWMLKDIPLIVAGNKGLAGPTTSGEPVPDIPSHLTIVACPPFGFWSGQLRGHVWQGGRPEIHKAAGHILKQKVRFFLQLLWIESGFCKWVRNVKKFKIGKSKKETTQQKK